MKALWLVLLLALPATMHAQFTFATNSGALTITDYTGSGGDVTIPSITNGMPVTGIGKSAFYASDLTAVTIPSSVTNIGEYAFFGCLSLTAITVDVQNSFYASVNGVLYDKNQTTLIQYPAGLVGCIIPASVTSIARVAFQYSGLIGVVIPNSVTNIGDHAFANCYDLTSVTIPNGVTAIRAGTFYNCTRLAHVTIPNSVSTIREWAFEYCLNLTSVIIPSSVVVIGDNAFSHCTRLTSAYFEGNAPLDNGVTNAFVNDPAATVYYLYGTTGWGSTFGGVPTVLWNPQALTTDASFGVRTNRFGFNITGTANIPVLVEASTNLSGTSWIPLESCTLTNGSFYFSDPQWMNYPARFYRLRWP